VQAAPLSDAERAFWMAFTRALIVVPRVLDAELIAEQHLSMTEYVVLMHLSEAADRRLRMSELAGRCALSLSGMSRVVSRLAVDGLVRRVRAGDDARGAFAVLTDAGLARLEAAYPDHLASVRRHVIDHLEGLDVGALTEALSRFATGTPCEPCAPVPECR
jgi:DNA-binding MarR family transcriptional regulator